MFLLGRRYTPVQLVGVGTSAVPLCWTALIRLMIVDVALMSEPLVIMHVERSAVKERSLSSGPSCLLSCASQLDVGRRRSQQFFLAFWWQSAYLQARDKRGKSLKG